MNAKSTNMIRTNSFLLAAFFAAVAWPATAQELIVNTSTTINTATSASRVIVGGSTAPGATLTIASPASITTSATTFDSFNVGLSSIPYAAVVQTGGTVTLPGGFIMSNNLDSLNSPYAGSASYTMSGGSLVMTGTADSANNAVIGRSGTATFTQSGGLFTIASANAIVMGGSPGSSGVYSTTGGTLEVTNTGTSTSSSGLRLSSIGGSGRLTINGSDAVVAIGAANMAMAVNGLNSATDKGDATVQLLNGTLAVNDNVTRGRPGTTGTNGPGSVAFTLGGGTLRPYSRDVNVGITTTGSNLLSFDVTLAANTLSTITGVGWKSGSAHTVTMFSNLVGSGSLQVTGGTVVLDSAGNTYSGATTIAGTNATLRLSAAGSFANSPTIRVGNAGSSGAVLDLTAKTGTFSFGSGQTVGGIGTIRMDAGDTARFAGTFSPGNSPGIFTFDGGTGLLSGTTVIEIFGATRGTGYDGVDLINGASLNYGSGVLALDFGSWLADQQSYQLFGSGSSSLLGSFSSVTIAGTNYAGLTFTNSGGVWTSQGTSPANQTLTFTEATGTLVIVPEPGAIALAGIGIAAAAWALRSRSPSRKRAG